MFRSETIKGEHGCPGALPKEFKLAKVRKLDPGKAKGPSSEKVGNKSVTQPRC